MCYKEKDKDYNYYRDLYIKYISSSQFPWEPAYYYYMQNIDRIDVMSFEDFKDELLTMNSLQESDQAAFEAVSLPIYETLDGYFDVCHLIDKEDNVIKLL